MSVSITRPSRRVLTAGLIGAVAGVVVALTHMLGLLETIERQSVDLRMAMRGPLEVDERIAILAIDESSIAALGQFPWPRSVHAAAIEALHDLGAHAVVFDVLFVDPDRNGAAQDADLADTLARHEHTVLAGFFEHVSGEGLVSLVPPLATFLEHASYGHANLTPDADGVLRELPLVVDNDGQFVPSLALAAYAATQSLSVEAAVETVPSTARPGSRLRLNFPGSVRAFPTLSYAGLILGNVPRSAIEGRTVFVGGTASGLFDTHAVPGQPVQHGVAIHAVALDNLLGGRYLKVLPPWLVAAGLVLIGLARGLSLAGGRAFLQVLVTMALVAAVVAGCVYALQRANLALPLLPALIVLVGTHIALVLWRLRTEERERRWIDRTFGHYLSPKIIAALKADPERLNLGGEKRELTVMFIDLAGFTAASTKLNPEQLARLLNQFLSEMSDIVLAHDGVIDKFLGDGMMAFWNAPVEQADHAARACRSALAQLERFDELREHWARDGLPPLDFRIGIATGPATVGNFGSRNRFDYTAIGETVNLAARLEAANKKTSTRCMVCERTRDHVCEAFATRPLGEIALHGLDTPTPAFELRSSRGPESTRAT